MNQSVSNLKSFVGTLAYTSPEVVENKPYTEKADIWSLGCLAYEMITLKTPFSSNNPLMLAKKVRLIILEITLDCGWRFRKVREIPNRIF